MHTRSTFIARYPEFARTGAPLVEATLAETALEVDQSNAHAHALHGALTAEVLWTSANGLPTKMVGEDKMTPYSARVRELRNLMGFGPLISESC